VGRNAQRIALNVLPVITVAVSGCNQATSGLGFGGMLAKTTLLLALVIGLAVLTLRLAARVGIGTSNPSSGKMQLLDELVLGPRESIVAISAGSKVLVASRTSAGLSPLATLTQADWNGRGFAEVLAEVNAERSAEGGAEAPEGTDRSSEEQEIDPQELVA
jgi:flagellar biogenesis protein FliO